MKKLLTPILCILVLFGFGGPRDFIKKVFNADLDFNGVTIYNIIQDHDGFLWIGSDDGMYRYDGKEMLNLNSKDSTIGNLITSTVISNDGHLYLGYFDGGVSIVEHGRYRKIFNGDSIEGRINGLKSYMNDIWALTHNGLIRLSGNKILKIDLPILDEMLAKDFIIQDDIIYIGTDQGLLSFNINGDEIQRNGFVAPTLELQINSLFVDENGIWIGSENGLFIFDPKADTMKRIDGFNTPYRISSIDKDDFNSVWLGTFESGLIQLEINGLKAKAITVFNRNSGFESDQIQKVFVDSENEIWAGTFGRGLVQLNRSYFHHYELFKTKRVQGVHSVQTYRQDELILGTENGLVRVSKPIMKDSLVFEQLAYTKQFVFTSLLVIGDVVWGGTRDNGVMKVDLTKKTVKRVFLNPMDRVEHDLIRDIQVDNDGNIWVSAGGNGVYHLTINGDLIEHYNTRNGFYHNEVFSILPDKAGNVWFGSPAAGLALLKDGEFVFLSKEEIFPSFSVNNLAQDESGNIWVTTDGDGIYKFDGEEFKRYTIEDGLLSNYCNALIVDNIGHVWVGHRLGLSLVQLDKGVIRTFSHPSELGETEAELNAVAKDGDGNIFFGNPYGITKVNLPHLNFVTKNRETHIKNIRLGYLEKDLLKYTEAEQLDDILPKDLHFPHDENHLTFDFVSINLRNPEAIHYKYKLEGFDKTWSPVSQTNNATYSNLDPGSYSFIVKESDHPAEWNEEYSTIDFIVKPPYWETWWFYSLQIGLILTILYVTYILSARIKNQFALRLMVYVCVFIAFEYIHTELEPWVESITGETPIFQVGMNLMLALVLLPVEFKLIKYIKNRSEQQRDHEGLSAIIRQSIGK